MNIRAAVSIFALSIIALLAYALPQHGLTRLAEPKPAPAFNLKDTQGKTHSLAEYRGKVVVVNFWATWCRPCREEMPSLQRAWDTLRGEGVQVLAINMGETAENVGVFTAKSPVDFPLLLDTDSSVTHSYEVKGLPTTYIVDPAGRLVIQVIGEYEWDGADIMKQIRDLKGT